MSDTALDPKALEAALGCYSEGGCSGLAEHERKEVVASIVDAYLSALPDSGAGWRDAEPKAWLVEWIQEDEHWVDAHADECRAVDQARRMGGICTPLVALPAAPDRRAGE